MDTVAFDFTQRVLMTRKCCEHVRLCRCSKLSFAARNWNQPELIRISFHIGIKNGDWKYGFRNESGAQQLLSMDELVKFPDFKNVRLCKIFTWEENNRSLIIDVVEMEKLLKFVSLIANEPALDLHHRVDEFFDSANGNALHQWLTESWFSHIETVILSSRKEHLIVEKQFSRWKPTQITVESIEESEEFLENRLMSGDLRRFHLHDRHHEFSSAVLQRIIRNVLEAPEGYAEKTLRIEVSFEDSAEEMVKQMAEEGLCTVEELPESVKYTIKLQTVFLTVEIELYTWEIRSGISS